MIYGSPGFFGGNWARQGQMNTQERGFDSQLAQGVKGGALNKDEFMGLASYDQQTREMEGKFLKDGNLTPQERSMLDSRNHYNQRMMQMYESGDFHPDQQMPQNQVEARMQNQLSRTYDGLQGGSMTVGEGTRSLFNQGENSLEYGRVQNFWGGMSPMANGYMNNRLDNTGAEIFNLKHNWASDQGSPLPYNESWQSPFQSFGWRPFSPFMM